MKLKFELRGKVKKERKFENKRRKNRFKWHNVGTSQMIVLEEEKEGKENIHVFSLFCNQIEEAESHSQFQNLRINVLQRII